MDSNANVINEEWIRKKLNIDHDNLEDIKSMSLPGTYQEKISHMGNSLMKFIRLKELDLSRNSLYSLEGLENLKMLEKLNLYYNNISSLKELERLRHNPALIELDLRLNPITKEENDYRLFLIQILPSLRMLDDRGIRDSERQMAITFFDQANHHNKNNGYDIKMNNSRQFAYDSFTNGSINPRVKSVNNIAKRSAGIQDTDDDSNYHNLMNMHIQDGINGSQNGCENNTYSKKQVRIEEYSPKALKEMSNLESQSYNTLAIYNGNRDNLNNTINGIHCEPSSKEFSKSKSCSMLNLKSSCAENQNYVDDYKEESYKNQISKKSFQDGYDDHHSAHTKLNDDHKIFQLLDLVDRYWNGSKSLHKNYKFLTAANQILAQSSSDNGYQDNDAQYTMYQVHIKQLADENRRLQQELKSRTKTVDFDLSKYDSSDGQYKNLILEIDALKKKYVSSQEENKKLRQELSEKSERHKDFALDSIENQNGSLKRDIEIMRIKLKQYEQLQQLTSMLQESHKSLVTTNEHLLQEINCHKQGKNVNTHFNNHNDLNMFTPPMNPHDPQGYYNQNTSINNGSMRKQYDQNSNNNNRMAYSIVK